MPNVLYSVPYTFDNCYSTSLVEYKPQCRWAYRAAGSIIVASGAVISVQVDLVAVGRVHDFKVLYILLSELCSCALRRYYHAIYF